LLKLAILGAWVVLGLCQLGLAATKARIPSSLPVLQTLSARFPQIPILVAVLKNLRKPNHPWCLLMYSWTPDHY